MRSIKVNLMFWVAGWVAGVILMERWRRHGGRYVPVESVDAVAASSASTVPSASDGKRRTSALIVAGAKADAERIRRLLNQAMPSRSDDVGATTSR
jgi:hypothetical protein